MYLTIKAIVVFHTISSFVMNFKKVMKMSVSAAYIAVADLIFYSCGFQHKLNIVSAVCSDLNAAFQHKVLQILVSDMTSKATNVMFIFYSLNCDWNIH